VPSLTIHGVVGAAQIGSDNARSPNRPAPSARARSADGVAAGPGTVTVVALVDDVIG